MALGLLNGLRYTASRLVKTYLSDLKHLGRRYDDALLKERQSVRGSGIFTVQYPEERLPAPENFRFIPFLVYEPALDENGQPKIDPTTGKPVIGKQRCTACGICAKVCPPQCIWIVRATTPEGKPKPQPAEFYIDIDVCMNCGLCAEFCPFDAIKMDHVYELAGYERQSHIFDIHTLSKPASYHAQIHPTDWAREEVQRKAKAKK
jgi:NADH-quinone oxidoreductase subunit I